MSFMNWIHNIGASTAVGRWIGLRPNTASRDDTLALRPVRNPAVLWDSARTEAASIDDSGDAPKSLMLTVPRKTDRLTGVLARILQAPSEKRIELDEFGAAIWERCDGTRTVDELARFTSTEYKLNRRQAEVSVMAFMKMLSERRLIGFLMEGKGVSHGTPSVRKRNAKRRGDRKRRF